MNRRRASILMASMTILVGLPSCHSSTNYRAGYPAPPRPGVAPPCDRCQRGAPLPPRFNPNPPPVMGGPLPAGPAVPPGAGPLQQNSFVTPAPATPPAAGVFLEGPQPIGGEAAGSDPARPIPNPPPSPEATRQYSPQTPEPPMAKKDGAATPALPVDIPQFAIAKPDIANGLEPNPEGVAWLKAHGYRTVLHVRAPGEDDREIRRLCEQNGLRFLTLEVSPQTLNKEIVDQFNRMVGEANNRPLFVYDRDSSLAGGLWYSHFRLVDKASGEKAADDAAQLGFKKDDAGPHKTMWVAVQNLFATMKSDR